MRTWWEAVRGDDAALAALNQEIFVELETLKELGIIAKEQGGVVIDTLPAVRDSMINSLDHFVRNIHEGDYEELKFQTAKFLAENPDLALEPLIAARAWQKIAQSAIRQTDDNIGRTVARQAKQQQESFTSRVARAERDGVDIPTVLAAGDELDFDLLAKGYGINRAQVIELQWIARETNCVITFQARNPISDGLLKADNAWPKPQALKYKTVNRIEYRLPRLSPGSPRNRGDRGALARHERKDRRRTRQGQGQGEDQSTPPRTGD